MSIETDHLKPNIPLTPETKPYNQAHGIVVRKLAGVDKDPQQIEHLEPGEGYIFLKDNGVIPFTIENLEGKLLSCGDHNFETLAFLNKNGVLILTSDVNNPNNMITSTIGKSRTGATVCRMKFSGNQYFLICGEDATEAGKLMKKARIEGCRQ